MKIDFSLPILDFDGEKIPLTKRDALGKELLLVPGKFVTLATVAVDVLNIVDDPNLDPKEKVERFILATKVVLGGEVELEPEDVVLIKKMVGKMHGPLVFGRVSEILADANRSK